MPYSDLTDAWNSYDPRYLRVSDNSGQPAFPGSYISDPQPVGKSLPVQRDDWTRGGTVMEAAPPAPPNALADVQSQDPVDKLRAYLKARDEARSYLDINRQLREQEKYNYGTREETGERDRLTQEDLASRFPSWSGLFDPRPMIGAIGRTFDPRPLMESIDSGFNKIHDAVFPPARGAAPSFDDSQSQGPTRPGYNYPSTLARVYNDIQRDLKLSPDQALGFLSNLNAESFGFTRPQEDAPLRGGKGGLGWGQWTAARRDAFEDYLRQTGASPTSYEGNYGFLLSELQDPKWQPFLDNLRRQRGAESSTRYTERGYENPSRRTGRQDWLARTRRELPTSANVLGQEVRGAAPPPPPPPPNALETYPF